MVRQSLGLEVELLLDFFFCSSPELLYLLPSPSRHNLGEMNAMRRHNR